MAEAGLSSQTSAHISSPSHPLGITTDGRRDTTRLEAWVARGVPRGNITLPQDRAATRAAVLAAFAAAVQATQPGEMLWHYYAGRGMRVAPARNADMAATPATYFVPYDGTLDGPDTGRSLASIGETLAGSFRGSSVLLTADRCACAAPPARRRRPLRALWP